MAAGRDLWMVLDTTLGPAARVALPAVGARSVGEHDTRNAWGWARSCRPGLARILARFAAMESRTADRLAGIDKHVTLHVLRHSTATAFIRAGNGIEAVAARGCGNYFATMI